MPERRYAQLASQGEISLAKAAATPTPEDDDEGNFISDKLDASLHLAPAESRATRAGVSSEPANGATSE